MGEYAYFEEVMMLYDSLVAVVRPVSRGKYCGLGWKYELNPSSLNDTS